jgi:hypothetical protein
MASSLLFTKIIYEKPWMVLIELKTLLHATEPTSTKLDL